ncbi:MULTISPECIES: hypothetical protein [Carnobacterium]|uniref:Uncharacterized protein n=1 Tax=Carnobacterium antarcticum TaxID=2126436 RepID=A0ABW4NNM5_9LACT|nr:MULTISPECIES: hypothetical protein [unclassified Carnobacterium]ALV20688.1 hypothetical protein NY10_61 [Carnobacterium sp. CP1]QQP70923.1 hypothetical protein JHE06_03840 [Carnobacterium sp. CS13]
MNQEELRNEIISIYKSGEGIKEKMDGLKGTLSDGDIVDAVEHLYDEGILALKPGKDAFVSGSRAEDNSVVLFWPEALEYKN